MTTDAEDKPSAADNTASYKSPDQLSDELVTLSLLPQSRWRHLTSLELIKVSELSNRLSSSPSPPTLLALQRMPVSRIFTSTPGNQHFVTFLVLSMWAFYIKLFLALSV